MSTIRVDNFGPSAGGTTYPGSGVPKAGLSYDQATLAIARGDNISSVTDVSAGLFNPTFTNVFTAADYLPGVNASNLDGTYDTTAVYTTSAVRLQTFSTTTASLADNLSASIFVGDLA